MNSFISHLSVTDFVLIVGTLTTSIVTIIGALKAKQAAEVSQDNSKKLEVVSKQTNGNLAEMKTKLEKVEQDRDRLHRITQELANAAPAGTLAEIKSREGDKRSTD